MPSDSSHSSSGSRLPVFWLIPGTVAAWIPLMGHWSDMTKFFYQGDEWAQLHELESLGLIAWLFGFFGENFMPVFKLFWSALLFVGQGNYLVFLIAGFALHAGVVFLLGLTLRNWGFGLFVILFSQLVLALNYTHIEILTQSIQSSNLLAYGFLLGLLAVVPKTVQNAGNFTWKNGLLVAGLSLLGALCFSRGVLNGWIGAAALLLLGLQQSKDMRCFIRPLWWMVIPAGLLTALLAYRSFQSLPGNGDDAGGFINLWRHLYYQISLNPWHQQIRSLGITPGLAAGLLFLNLFTALAGLLSVRDSRRALLSALLGFFLGNAFLLALGRSHQAIEHTASWRYQYGVLLVFTPLVATAIEKGFKIIPCRLVRLPLQLWLLWWVSHWVYDHWKYYVPEWSIRRGVVIRDVIETAPEDPQGTSITQFAGVDNRRALELIGKYGLH